MLVREGRRWGRDSDHGAEEGVTVDQDGFRLAFGSADASKQLASSATDGIAAQVDNDLPRALPSPADVPLHGRPPP
jgi:hypothetical protein